jgi:transcription initiation factor IIE alpha subunit
MTTRAREALIERNREEEDAIVSEIADKLSPMHGCCQDHEGKANGQACPQCGEPMRDYDRATMLEVARERL